MVGTVNNYARAQCMGPTVNTQCGLVPLHTVSRKVPSALSRFRFAINRQEYGT